MNNPIFTGGATAVTTPFKPDSTIDFDAFERLIDFQLDNGAKAIVVCGTTGESAALTDREQRELIECCAARVRGRAPVIAGAGSNNTEHAVRLARAAKSAGADAHLQITPYYNRTTQAGVTDHFLYIADRVDLPMILYNVPSRTGVNILPQTYAGLARHANIAAIKEANGNLAALARTLDLCEGRLDVYCGDDALTLPMLALGAKGVISVLANLTPDKISALCDAFFSGDLSRAAQMQIALSGLIEALFADPNPIPVKAAQAMMGLCGGTVRLPLSAPGTETRVLLRDRLRRHGLI